MLVYTLWTLWQYQQMALPFRVFFLKKKSFLPVQPFCSFMIDLEPFPSQQNVQARGTKSMPLLSQFKQGISDPAIILWLQILSHFKHLKISHSHDGMNFR